MYKETNTRSFIKSISWRINGTLATSAIVYFISGKAEMALAVGFFEFFSKVIIFYFHERAWNKISFGKRALKPAVIWLTGLSGAGKSTIAEALVTDLRRQGIKVEHLDGDTVRDIFPTTGFSKKEREEHIKRIGYLANQLEKNGIFVVASFISPYEDSRRFVRALCQRFIEVHVATPLALCEQRDPKGLYKKARSGDIKNFTGISDPYEVPVNPELTIDTGQVSLEDSVRLIKNLVLKN